MTTQEKKKINYLRAKGMSLANIAITLDISINTIKSYCRRNSVPTKQQKPCTCKECGKPIKQDSNRKEKLFCSYQCRMKWWKVHADSLTRNAIYIFNCPVCKKDFEAYGNKTRKYCSHACYINGRFGNRYVSK